MRSPRHASCAGSGSRSASLAPTARCLIARDRRPHRKSIVCGIWFSLGFAPDAAHIDAVAHRGRDGSGWRVFETGVGPVALGHRRLSIIDLSDAALQPMSYADGRYWIVYNGEIYNYLELREELRAKGHVFRTQSDTEVLLAAFAHWGEAVLDRLVGMFAFVLWDCQTQIAFAARDHFGVKPLYFF